MTTPPPKRRTRRFLQFSLRSLLIFVLLVSIGMSWFGVKLERARRQREAVEAIEESGFVYHDYGHGSGDPFVEPSIPKWARSFLGDDFFFDVVRVECVEDFGNDEASHLETLTNLTFLNLANTQITDAGLEHLEGLTSLTHLHLANTAITDAGLEHLGGLTNLEWLDLQGTQITDDGLEHLEGLTNLTNLYLNETQVTDAGLIHLEGLTSLTDLGLFLTQITDAGLKHLKGLTSLGKVYLLRTQVTPEGCRKLQEALPCCKII